MKKDATHFALMLPDGSVRNCVLPPVPMSLQAFRLHMCNRVGRELRQLDTFYPCFKCEGSGRIYDPGDPACPIEGNKLRSRIKCPECEGRKTCALSEFKRIWKVNHTRAKEGREKAVQAHHTAQLVLKRMSGADWESLKRVGFWIR